MNRTSGSLAYKPSPTRRNSRKVSTGKKRVTPVRVSSGTQRDKIDAAEKLQRQMSRKRAFAIVSAVLIISLISGVFAGVLYRYSQILEMNYSNIRLEKEISDIRQETRDIKSLLEEKTDLNHIGRIASERLNMRVPGEGQTRRVAVPVNDILIVEYNLGMKENEPDNTDDIYENLEMFFKRFR